MNILKFTSFENGVEQGFQKIFKYNPQRICLTGGNFGLKIVELLKENLVDISSWDIFLTDERLNCSVDLHNSENILNSLVNLPGFSRKRFHCFTQKKYNESYRSISRSLNGNFFDLTLLSLGEDGHLAGHFIDSQFLDDKRFCYTNNAEKLPRERISFSIPWLMKSKVIILAVFGENKKKALEELADGSGLHSKIWNMNNLVLMTDQDLEKEKIR